MAELFGSSSFLILLANSFHAANEAGKSHVRVEFPEHQSPVSG